MEREHVDLTYLFDPILRSITRAWTASSRLFYALARDNALPFKPLFMSLTPGQAPWLGVWISVFVGSVICCAYIGSPVACKFNIRYLTWNRNNVGFKLTPSCRVSFLPFFRGYLFRPSLSQCARCGCICYVILLYADTSSCDLAR